MYEGKADCGQLGLIVTQATQHDEPNAVGACTGAAGETPQQICAREPITSEQGKIRVQVPGSLDRTLLLQPADLQPL